MEPLIEMMIVTVAKLSRWRHYIFSLYERGTKVLDSLVSTGASQGYGNEG